MLHLCYSNRFEKLVEALAARIDRGRSNRGGVFHKARVVVPNVDQADFLELQLARRNGMAANIEFHMLQSFLRDVVLDEPALERTELVDRSLLHVRILELFHDQGFLSRTELAPVVDYISHVDDEDARDIRRYQLARQLATLFEEYSYSRPEMLERWGAEARNDQQTDSVTRWQRLIWRELAGTDQTLVFEDDDGQLRRLMTLGRMFADDVFTDQMLGRAMERIGTFHLFGLPSLGETFRKVIKRLADGGIDVHAYVLNPCRGDWSSMPTARPDELESSHADSLTPAAEWEPEDENPALRLWGRIGRDNLHGLENIAEDAAENHFQEAQRHGKLRLLEVLQNDILDGRPEKAARSTQTPDPSVQLLACSGVQREVEAVANEIWSLIKEAAESQETLNLNDIAIVVNSDELDTYVAQIKAVFDGFYRLPYNVFGLPARSQSRLIEATHLLLALPFGTFKRDELLRLLVHPNVRAHFPEIDADTWVQWCDDLNILHGGSREDHRNTYIDGDLYNWDQGLRRLALGTFLRADQSHADAAFEHAGWNYYPREVSTGEFDTAAQFSALARSLIEDTRWLRDTEQKRTLEEWADILADFVQTYLTPAQEDAHSFDRERHELTRCILALRRLKERAVTDQKFPYRTAYLFAIDELDQLESSVGKKFIEGVVVSSLSRLRGLPFKHLFMLGMGEGKLPAVDTHNQLDLRRQTWRRGDVLLSDRDKFAFLESLMSTRVGLHLSWVAREASTGESLAPSSLMSELSTMLELFDVPAVRDDACTIKHPLRRYHRSSGYFPDLADRQFDEERGPATTRPNLHPEAFVEAKMQALRQELLKQLDGRELPDIHQLRKAAPWRRDRRWGRLHSLLGIFDPATPDGEQEVPPMLRGRTEPIQVSLSQLRQFLETPFQTTAKAQYGVYGEDEGDALSIQNETFEASAIDRVVLLRDVFCRALAHPDGLAAVDKQQLAHWYEELLLPRHQIDGALATGPFGDVNKKEHLAVLDAWKFNVDLFDGHYVAFETTKPARVLSFGDARGWHTDREPPLRVEVPLENGETVLVDLVGTTEPVSANFRTLVTPIYKDKRAPRYCLRGYLSHLMLSATGLFEPPGTPHERKILLAFNEQRTKQTGEGTVTTKLQCAAPGKAVEQLQRLLRDYLTTTHPSLMPIELIDDFVGTLSEEDPTPPFDKLVRDDLNSGWTKGSYRHGPIKDLDRYPACEDPRPWIESRFKYLYELDATDG